MLHLKITLNNLYGAFSSSNLIILDLIFLHSQIRTKNNKQKTNPEINKMPKSKMKSNVHFYLNCWLSDDNFICYVFNSKLK